MRDAGQPTFTGVRRLPAQDYIYRLPLMPWICPPLHPELARVVENIGVHAVLLPGERLFQTGEPVRHIALVRRGMVARKLGDYGSVSDNHIALAPPGNLASGNLNLFSHRPAVGSYSALMTSEIIWCDQRAFLAVVEKDPDLLKLLLLQCELSALSDRLTFACKLLQKADVSLRIFNLVWAFNYGHIEGDRVVAQRVLTRDQVKNVLGCSIGWLDRILKEWRAQGVRSEAAGTVSYPLAFLEEADRCLVAMEEKSGAVMRARNIRDYWMSA